MSRDLSAIKTIMVKVGSSSLCDEKGRINKERILGLVQQISKLRKQGYKMVLVSSGAVAAGAGLMGFESRPLAIPKKQALAAIGQGHLMQIYEEIFELFDLKVAQILLNHSDFDDRKRLLNLYNTINALTDYGAIPIINENDALAVEEIKVGDNDTLAALLVPVVEADLVILVSDIDGLYTKNPREYDDAILLKYVEKVDDEIWNMAGASHSAFGTGGMQTKLNAAKIVNAYGSHMVIVNGEKENYLLNIFNEKEEGTWFKGDAQSMSARTHWLAYRVNARGKIIVDEGAGKALLDHHKSLLPGGIIGVEGQFLKDHVVTIETKDQEIGRGIVNYSSDEIRQIMGKHSDQIEAILHYKGSDVVIHANNMILKR